MRIEILRVDGSREEHEAHKSGAIAAVEKLIGAKLLDTVNLRDGRVMFVDDASYETRTVDHGDGRYELKPIRALKPVNEQATQMYWAICAPGTTHQILGDVAIVRDADFS